MWEKELEVALDAAKKAAAKIMEFYVDGFDVEIKSDNSPVTDADKASDKIIRETIQSAYPTHAFLTEESEDDKNRLNNDFVWIVDPIDGTKDFIAKDDEFTISIALAYKHEIVVGVICAPALNEYYYATKDGGAFSNKKGAINKMYVNDKITDLTCLTSVFHVKQSELDLIQKYSDKITKSMKVGSCLKACRIAEGNAEISYRLSDGTKEWDIAASVLVINEAGGVFLKPDKTPIKFNREDVYNREGYVIANKIENFLL